MTSTSTLSWPQTQAAAVASTPPHGCPCPYVAQLPKLQQDFEGTIETIVEHLQSIQVYATGAPVILVGTRKDQVTGGVAALADLSEKLLDALQRRCGPAVEGLLRDPDSGLCFFAIENTKGFKGDATIRQLVQAIERTARKQASMKLTLPAAWLRVLDASRSGRSAASCRGGALVAQQHGLPSADVPSRRARGDAHLLPLAQRYALVRHAHVAPALVILDVKWVVDAATCFIRQYDPVDDHTENYKRAWPPRRAGEARGAKSVGPAHKEQRHPAAQGSATTSAPQHPPPPFITSAQAPATLTPTSLWSSQLLRILWSSEDFKDHQDALLDLMIRFNLAIPLRSGDFLVPALLTTQGVASLPDAPAASSAQMRIFFFLDGQAPDGSLTCSPHELSDGFLPAGVFHRLCAAAIGCSHEEANAVQPSLTYRQVSPASPSPALSSPALTSRPSSPACSSVCQGPHRHGRVDRDAQLHGVVVVDPREHQQQGRARRLGCRRVRPAARALAQETSLFKNLRYRMLALVEGTTRWWTSTSCPRRRSPR